MDLTPATLFVAPGRGCADSGPYWRQWRPDDPPVVTASSVPGKTDAVGPD